MPLYFFQCKSCNRTTKDLLSPEEASQVVWCEHTGCGGVLERTMQPPSSQTNETIDNGIMARRVERPVGIQDLILDRNSKNYREK